MVAYLIFGWLISYFLLALIKPLFVRAGWVDEPVRPWHPMGAEVTSGGLGLLGTLFIGLLGLHSGASEIIVILGTFTLMFGVGFLNDRGLFRSRFRLIGQIVASLVLVVGTSAAAHKVQIASGFDLATAPHLGLCVATVWMVAVINAFDISPSSDTVSCGYSIVALLAVLVVNWLDNGALLRSSPIVYSIALISLAALVGFFLYNFRLFGQRFSRSFLGHGGNMLLGTMLAWTLLEVGASKLDKPLSFWFAAWLVAIPVFDAGFGALARLTHRRDPLYPRYQHLYHLLRRLDFSRRQIALTVYCSSIGLAAIGVGFWYWSAPEYVACYLFVMLFGLYSGIVATGWSIASDESSWRKTRFTRSVVKRQGEPSIQERASH